MRVKVFSPKILRPSLYNFFVRVAYMLHYSVFPFNDREDVFEALGASQPYDKLYQPCHFS